MGTCQVGAANIFHCCVFGSATFSPLALAYRQSLSSLEKSIRSFGWQNTLPVPAEGRAWDFCPDQVLPLTYPAHSGKIVDVNVVNPFSQKTSALDLSMKIETVILLGSIDFRGAFATCANP
jgi:hypothetical protein